MSPERLKDYIDIRAELEQLERLRETLYREAKRSEARGWSPHATKQPGFRALVSLYDEKIERNRQELREIEAAIDAVPDQQSRELLRLRYIEGLTWDAITAATCYSWTAVHNHHRKALTFL